MLSEIWPPYGLEVVTPRLRMRLPDDAGLAALARLAATGLHAPGERPFLTPWTEDGPEARARHVAQGHWERLGSWEPGSWRLGLGVWADGEPVGMVTLRADDFAVVREVSTASWLGLAHQGRGLGTEARTGLLALAFDHLGATDATTEVFPDNLASQGVSRRLGYVADGISRDARGSEALVSDRLRLTREVWRAQPRVPVEVTGLDACRDLLGAT